MIAQGYERQPAMNCLGLYLFTQLLPPAFEGHGEEFAPEFSACNLGQFSGCGRHGDAMEPPGGIDMSLVMAAIADDNVTYAQSKTATWFPASELAREVGRERIISITQNRECSRREYLVHHHGHKAWPRKAVATGRWILSYASSRSPAPTTRVSSSHPWLR